MRRFTTLLVDVEAPPVAGKSIRSVSVLQRSNGQIVFCKALSARQRLGLG